MLRPYTVGFLACNAVITLVTFVLEELPRLNFAMFLLMTVQINWHVSKWINVFFLKKMVLLFICESFTHKSLFGLMNGLTWTLYYYMLFRSRMCKCTDIEKAMPILLVVNSCFTILQLVFIAVFTYIFFNKRYHLWREIVFLEDSLTFHDEIKTQCNVVCKLSDFFDIHSFIIHWTVQSHDQLIYTIPTKAQLIYTVFTENMDTSRDNKISLAEFKQFCCSHNIIEHSKLWELFSDGENITLAKIEDALHQLYYDRQRLAFAIKTDFKIINALLLHIAFVVYAGAFVFITRILDYEDAFGPGVDLFKIYILVISYIATNCKDRIKFIVLMLTKRPFNLGDLLLYEHLTYTVSDISPGFTYFLGHTPMMIQNSQLMNNPVYNLSTEKVYDSMQFCFSPNISNECIKDVHKSIKDFAVNNPRIINVNFIICSWIRMDKACKVVQCSWKYNFMICDRTSYNMVRARVYNHIMASISNKIIDASLAWEAASGGAFNSIIKNLS